MIKYWLNIILSSVNVVQNIKEIILFALNILSLFGNVSCLVKIGGGEKITQQIYTL